MLIVLPVPISTFSSMVTKGSKLNKAAQLGGAIYIEDSDLNLDGDTFIEY